jgi:hypothetical protein
MKSHSVKGTTRSKCAGITLSLVHNLSLRTPLLVRFPVLDGFHDVAEWAAGVLAATLKYHWSDPPLSNPQLTITVESFGAPSLLTVKAEVSTSFAANRV